MIEKKQSIAQTNLAPKNLSDIGEDPSDLSIQYHSIFKQRPEKEYSVGEENTNYQQNFRDDNTDARTVGHENFDSKKYFSSPVGLIYNKKEGLPEEEVKGIHNINFENNKLDLSSDEDEKVTICNLEFLIRIK